MGIPLSILLLFGLLPLITSDNNPTNLQTYIIQLNPQSRSHYSSTHKWHLSILKKTIITTSLSETSPSSRLLYSYHSAMEGFSAILTTQELQTLKTHPDIIAVRPDTLLHLHTTYSYKFLGLNSPTPTSSSSPWSISNYGRGTIIGVLDTGIWPESPSFNDDGIPPPPKSWKGICQQGHNKGDFNSTNCNNKLIGARFFMTGHRTATSSSRYVTKTPPVLDYSSPRDSSGHGTHTSSTAGGSPVLSASVLGYGEGEAQGMAPGAHIAMYKVCWVNGCYTSDVLAGMEAAINDGVNVLSLSLGGFPVPLYDDSIAIGSFRAVENGISVVCAAGNNGPIPNSVANEAPWITTVGASTLDRRFPAYVRMGNGNYLYGESIYNYQSLNHHHHQLPEAEVVYVTGGGELCITGTLPRSVVHGKIVVCDRGINGRAEKGDVVKKSGGIGMILSNTKFNLEEDSVDVHLLPATLIGYKESIQLKRYINTTQSPRVKILFSGTVFGRARAPAVARFSSRGPSLNNPGILKPDLIAPGVNIIAAWPENLGPTGLADDSRRVNFTVLSGTSMSCPHVSGISALLRSKYPEWSPAAVKSALMTTTDITDHKGMSIMDGESKASLFAMGAGQVSPGKALEPGLVYDVRTEEYVTHLCSLSYTSKEIFTITHKNVSCRQILKRNRGFSLNYPSISVEFKRGKTKRTIVVTRRVTNVGEPRSTYSLEIEEPQGVKVIVRPRKLVFHTRYQTLAYKVYFISKRKDEGDGFGQGYLTWMNCDDKFSRVRSPISITWKK